MKNGWGPLMGVCVGDPLDPPPKRKYRGLPPWASGLQISISTESTDLLWILRIQWISSTKNTLVSGLSSSIKYPIKLQSVAGRHYEHRCSNVAMALSRL